MDDLLKDAIQITFDNGSGSASLLQRKLNLGYNRAIRIMLEMEQLNIIGPLNGAKPQELLIKNIEEIIHADCDICWKEIDWSGNGLAAKCEKCGRKIQVK